MKGEKEVELTYSHQHIKNTSTCEKFSQYILLNTGKIYQTPRSARRWPHNQVGKNMGKKKKELRWDLNPSGSYERGKESPLLIDRLARTERELQGLRGE